MLAPTHRPSFNQGLHLRRAARDYRQCRPSGEKDWTFPRVHSRRVGLLRPPNLANYPFPGGGLGGRTQPPHVKN